MGIGRRLRRKVWLATPKPTQMVWRCLDTREYIRGHHQIWCLRGFRRRLWLMQELHKTDADWNWTPGQGQRGRRCPQDWAGYGVWICHHQEGRVGTGQVHPVLWALLEAGDLLGSLVLGEEGAVLQGQGSGQGEPPGWDGLPPWTEAGGWIHDQIVWEEGRHPYPDWWCRRCFRDLIPHIFKFLFSIPPVIPCLTMKFYPSNLTDLF